MSIEEILEDMDELLDKATSMPFSPHKSVIDAERMRELINDARLNVPQEVRQAQSIAYDRDRIIKDAEPKAEK
ncbi:MAG: vacuolar-type H+-ATPase subunit H, partial [Oscillospiraceae bacterium]|nr:vacuolar-type H+-ATPase subunit H [Oscillospiraceae bacterium]